MTFVFDIDGTLSFDGVTIDPQIRRALDRLRAAGHRVIFASARPIRDLQKIIAGLGAEVLIGGNGALIQDQSGVVTAQRPLTAATTARLKRLIVQADLDYVMDSHWDYAARVQPSDPIQKQLDPHQLARRLPLAELQGVVKVILLNLTTAQRAEVLQILQDQPVTVVEHAGEGHLDITAAGIDKFGALKQLGIDDYVAFGNDHNDRTLLAHAQRAVWVTSKPALGIPVRRVQPCAATPAHVAEMITQFCR